MFNRYTKRNEMDRPTSNSLVYLTKVRPQKFDHYDHLVDPYIHNILANTIGIDTIKEFGHYTRSFYTLEGHYSNLWKYDRPILPAPTHHLLYQAISHSTQCFKLDYPVTSISWNNLKEVPFIPSSASGWGYIGKKGAPGNHERAIRMAVFSLHQWDETRSGTTSNPFRYHPDIAYYRTQISTPDRPKIRHIWGEAFHNIILEGMSAAPLLNAYQHREGPIAIGKFMFKRLPSIIHRVLNTDDEQSTGIGIDFEAFDSSVQPWLIREAFNILRQNIIFPEPMSELAFDYSVEHFINRPVVMPDGRMWLTRVGIPSGSYFTSLIGSIVNHIAISYAQLCSYQRTFPLWVCGDDSLYGLPYRYGTPNMHQISEHLAYLGLSTHPDKCVTAIRASELEFLGHTAKHIRVSRETADMMRLALYPEQPVTSPEISISRIKGILIDSGLTNWPILHLHDLLMAKYRMYLKDDTAFTTENANFLKVVMNISTLPSKLDVLRAWTLT